MPEIPGAIAIAFDLLFLKEEREFLMTQPLFIRALSLVRTTEDLTQLRKFADRVLSRHRSAEALAGQMRALLKRPFLN